MKNTQKALLISVALVATAAAQAIMINGNMGFIGRVELYDLTPNAATMDSAIGASSWNSFSNPGYASIEDGDLTFAGLGGGKAEIATPWTFNSAAINDFWMINGFTFDLFSSVISSQSANGLVVSGKGILRAIGFDDTPADWYFSTQGTPNSNGRYSFSASTNTTRAVPDPSSTLALMGMGILTLGIAYRRSK